MSGARRSGLMLAGRSPDLAPGWPEPGAWELACHASLTGALLISRHLLLSASARRIFVLTRLPGTHRARSSARITKLGDHPMGERWVRTTNRGCPLAQPGRR